MWIARVVKAGSAFAPIFSTILYTDSASILACSGSYTPQGRSQWARATSVGASQWVRDGMRVDLRSGGGAAAAGRTVVWPVLEVSIRGEGLSNSGRRALPDWSVPRV